MNRRLALIQALISAVALAAVIWWATKQEAPELPSGTEGVAWLLASLALYALATLLRAERWHQILAITGVHASRPDCYGLTCVGYMGNNVLPRVRARCCAWCCSRLAVARASARLPGRSWPSACST